MCAESLDIQQGRNTVKASFGLNWDHLEKLTDSEYMNNRFISFLAKEPN
jgi:hypothetical protein